MKRIILFINVTRSSKESHIFNMIIFYMLGPQLTISPFKTGHQFLSSLETTQFRNWDNHTPKLAPKIFGEPSIGTGRILTNPIKLSVSLTAWCQFGDLSVSVSKLGENWHIYTYAYE